MAHMTKQELKHDEMADLGGKVNEWYERHSTLITTILVVLALGMLGYKGYGMWKNSRDAQTTAQFQGVLQNYGMALGQPDATKQKDFYAKAVSEAERVASENAGTAVGNAALLIAGNAHYYYAMALMTKGTESAAELKSAQDAFEKYIAVAPTPAEKAAGRLALGNVLENQAYLNPADSKLKLEQAIKAYTEAEEATRGKAMGAEAKLALALLMANQEGRREEARKLFEEVRAERKLPDLTEKQKEQLKGAKDAQGREVKPEVMQDIRKLEDFSQEYAAERAVRMLNGIPGIPNE
jgi:hypothetical protein